MKRKLFLALIIASLCILPSQAQSAHTHLLDGGTAVTESTCKKPGETVYRCLDPDCDYTLSVTTPAGHLFGEAQMNAEASCEGIGWGQQICAVCSARKNITKEHTGHHMVPDEVLSEPTCKNGGASMFVCTECGFRERVTYPPLGHRLDVGTVEAEPTCTKNGLIRHTCTVEGCGWSSLERTEPLEHRWDEGIVTKEPTERSNGARLCTCQDCGATRVMTIPHLTEDIPPEK